MSSKPSTSPKTPSAKTHRRSRTGCFTCRLRRKKCDEGKPCCKACKNLGLQCEYKRPTWWSNVEQRKRHKENIKVMIKRTKLNEKVSQAPSPIHSHSHTQYYPPVPESTPDLAHFPSPSDSSDIHINMARRRSSSVGSGYSLEQYQTENMESEAYPYRADDRLYVHHVAIPEHGFPTYPYEAPIMTEKQMAMNGIQFRRDSIALKTSPITTTLLTPPSEPYDENVALSHPLSIPSSGEEFFFEFDSFATPDSQVQYIDVEEEDQPLLDHFLANVLPTLFPILDGDIRGSIIYPALSRNKCFLHCCLSIAALHKKATENIPSEAIDGEIMRHRYQTVYELNEALSRNENHLDILEATLGVILFQTVVGTVDDNLPDIAWHAHFQAAVDLISRLNLQQCLSDLASQNYTPAPFNMNLAAWIDILGSSMIGRTPEFADTYREKLVSGQISGLRELMGCDDRIMYLISETVCLEALILDGMLNEMKICEHVKDLALKIEMTESEPLEGHTPVTAAITDAFRYAARIYLCSLVPGFNPHEQRVKDLLNKLVACLAQIPSGANGFDRSLVWVYLIAGSVATPDSSFRQLFNARREELAEDASMGSFGRMVRIVEEVWKDRDCGGKRHWREVMRGNGWDFLMI